MLFEINLCCPDCGGYNWHQGMHQLEENEFCCADCGTVCTPAEMEWHTYETK